MSAKPMVLIEVPELGWPFKCGCAGDCAAGGCSGGCGAAGCSCGGSQIPNPLSFTLQQCVEWSSGPCPPGAPPSYGAAGAADPLAWAAALLARAREVITGPLAATAPAGAVAGRCCRATLDGGGR